MANIPTPGRIPEKAISIAERLEATPIPDRDLDAEVAAFIGGEVRPYTGDWHAAIRASDALGFVLEKAQGMPAIGMVLMVVRQMTGAEPHSAYSYGRAEHPTRIAAALRGWAAKETRRLAALGATHER